jgi:hypothetical protein
MSQRRLIYRNWIADLGRDPDEAPPAETCAESDSEGPAIAWVTGDEGSRSQHVSAAVEEALAGLSEDEREFIERFYYMGQTYVQISEQSGRAVHKLATLHRRATAKLKRRLAPLVAELYGVTKAAGHDCPICRSAERESIDRIIRSKPEPEPWGPTLCRLRETYGLTIKSPQAIIGHLRYH